MVEGWQHDVVQPYIKECLLVVSKPLLVGHFVSLNVAFVNKVLQILNWNSVLHVVKSVVMGEASCDRVKNTWFLLTDSRR